MDLGASNRSIDLTEISRYHHQVELRDGRQAVIRAIRSTDKLALLDGFRRLSTESIHYRFFGGKQDLSERELKYFTEVDFKTHVALVAETIDGKIPVGVGRFIVREKVDTKAADIAITVDEANHGLGVGTLLFIQLIQIARALGIQELCADVMTLNTTMIHIINRLELPMVKKEKGDLVNIRVLIKDTGSNAD